MAHYYSAVYKNAVEELFANVQAELGDSYELVNRQREEMEDPELDEYLLDPKGFERRKGWITKKSHPRTLLRLLLRLFSSRH